MVCKQLKLAVMVCLAFAGLAIVTSDASAWGRRHGSRGSYGSHGSYGSGGSYGSYGSYGSRGSYGSYGSYGSRGSWGSGGSHGYYRARSWGSCGSSGGSYGSYRSYGSYGGSGGIIESAPAAPVQEAAPADGDTTYRSGSDEVRITLDVPEDAKVFINGNLTKTTGTSRTYVSRGMETGRQYKYEIRAEVERDGELSSDSKVVVVRAGQRTSLAFNFGDQPAASQVADESAPSLDPPKTTLKLNVPSDAKVTLSGNETTSTGPVRVYNSRQLTAGQVWENYTIRAEVERDGQTLVRERSISLRGGESRELTIDFDTANAASVAAN